MDERSIAAIALAFGTGCWIAHPHSNTTDWTVKAAAEQLNNVACI